MTASYRCDRCGTEIDDEPCHLLWGTDTTEGFDLCGQCVESFLKWLEEAA